jgi:hypothetical protein
MCQAVSEGGRRCPVHQHQNIAAIRAAEHLSGLTRLQTERMFAELRREGRNAEPLTNRLHAGSIRRIRNSVADTAVAEAVAADLERSAAHDPQIDPASAYAQRALRERAVERAQQLNNRFQEVAARTGYSTQEVAAKYAEFREAVDTSRGSENPPEYDQNTRRAAVIANLPYDRASVVALVKLNSLVPAQEARRVTLTPAPEGSHIRSYGYDDGRMEVVFNSNPERIYAYQNISPALWERFSASDSPGRVFAREIRGNEDYAYTSEEEAETDAHRVRCAACGQFRAASHSCPEREVRAQLSETDLTAEQIEELVPNRLSEPVQETVVDTVEEVVAEETEEVEEEGNTGTTPVAERVTPAAHIPAQDVTSYTRTEEVPAGTELVGDDVVATATEQVPEEEVIPVTAASQRNPTAFDRQPLSVYSSSVTGYQTNTLVRGKDSPDSSYEAFRLPTYVSVFTNHQPGGIVARFDNRLYDGEVTRGRDSEGIYRTSYNVYHRAKRHAATNLTREEHAALLEEQDNMIDALVDSGDAVQLERTSSMTRKYEFDANRGVAMKIATANAVQFKRAIKDNKVAVIPIYTEAFNMNSNYVDDQGYIIEQSRNNNVSGHIAVRRNSEGVMEVLTSEHTLKCNCQKYRQHYSCEHVNYIQRHAGNLAQQMTPDTTAVQAARAARPEGTHRLMTAGLLTRDDVQIVSSETEGEEDWVKFTGATRAERASSAYSSSSYYRLVTPESLRQFDANTITSEQAVEVNAYKNLVQSLTSTLGVNKPAQMRTALKRSDVEVPVKALFHPNGWAWQPSEGLVEGSIRYKKTDDIQNAEIRSSSLRCSCADYAENYDCKHVRFVKDQHLAILGAGSRVESDAEHNLPAYFNRAAAALQREAADLNYMEQYGITREELPAHRAAAEERRQAEQAEALARRVERNRIIAEQAAEDRARRAMTERQRNQATVDQHNAYRERMKQRWETVEEGYSENPKAFYDDYKAALSRKRAGGEAIPFRTENVTDGICADEPGGRSFGIELEFDIKDGVNRTEALRKIGQELHAAGLTEQARQTGYHSAARSGWAKWSFEEDCTVSGELVSPIMKDTPEHWEQLRVATEIITRNGGVATTRTGSHVHVSTGSYEQSTAKHAELLRTVNNNEDIMYRLASNPATGKHRRGTWCQPNTDDRGGQFISHEVQDGHGVLGHHTSHHYAMNFEGTANPDYKKSHVEFRMWDGTLDPAVIQQQVMISAALTDHAERNVIANNGSTKPAPGDRVRIGNGKTKESSVLGRTRTHTEDTFKESSTKAAEFLDKLFRRREDRAAAASLFAVTKWQE